VGKVTFLSGFDDRTARRGVRAGPRHRQEQARTSRHGLRRSRVERPITDLGVLALAISWPRAQQAAAGSKDCHQRRCLLAALNPQWGPPHERPKRQKSTLLNHREPSDAGHSPKGTAASACASDKDFGCNPCCSRPGKSLGRRSRRHPPHGHHRACQRTHSRRGRHFRLPVA